MKDKTITNVHFDYVNEQVKIMGFKNLADYDTFIPYSKLKLKQKNICEKINSSIEWFKKIFIQEGFDLRKINYLFENIDQVIGFIKKLFVHLCIQYDYSRIKGIPTLRLIQPNNLYNNYIMNLGNIPQKENFISNMDINDNKIENIKSMTKLFDEFEKKEISSSLRSKNKIDLKLIPIDWINDVNISIINDNYKSTLPLGTIISLLIGDDEVILHNNNDIITINLPNNFLYYKTTVFLLINLPDKFDESITNTNFLFEFNGWKINNKDIINNLQNVIIKFDNVDLYSNYNMGIFDYELKINTDNLKSPYIYMNYLMNYLKKKTFDKNYIIKNTFDLSNLSYYNYFYWIKIKKFDDFKLPLNTLIQLILGDNCVLTYTINNDTRFDELNYFTFNIDFPNNILYKDDSIILKITLPEDKIIIDDEILQDDYYSTFKIIINGTNFKVSTPKMFFNINTHICFNHDSKWFIKDEKEFNSSYGKIFKKIKSYESDILTLFKKLYKDKLLTFDMIEIGDIQNENIIKELSIFADIDFKNNKDTVDVNSIMFLVYSDLEKYLQYNKFLINNYNSSSYSFGSNQNYGIVNFDSCELINEQTCKIYFKILNNPDFIKHIDLQIINSFEKTYYFNAYIEFDNIKVFDFGNMTINKNIRLDCDNKYISLLYKRGARINLVIEVPHNKFFNWKNINLSVGYIYSDTKTRQQVFSLNSPTVEIQKQIQL